MKFFTILKFLLILIMPFLLFLLVFNFAGFDNIFYKEKFSEYGVEENVPEAESLHQKVMDFISGKSNGLPDDFNQMEKEHLLDVRNLIKFSKIALYVFIGFFVLLLIMSGFILKRNNYIINFVGKVLVFGGFVTIILALSLFLLINSDFQAAFESFHRLFFEKGTYIFDPAKDIIVNLYPEELFMDLGIKISANVLTISAIAIILGALLVFKSKKNKNKKKIKH